MQLEEMTLKALIVDDSALMRKLVDRALRQSGVELSEVLEASTGLEALNEVRSAKNAGKAFDLILSDINMPVMDGLTFLEEMRKEDLSANVPIVMITTEGTEQYVLRAIANGARGYICKPFTAEQVKARILPLLQRAA